MKNTASEKIGATMKELFDWTSFETSFMDPLQIDWDIKQGPAYSITLNPEVEILSESEAEKMFSNPGRIFIPDLSSLVGIESYGEVMKRLQYAYGAFCYFPGYELPYYYLNNSDKIPKVLKDGKYNILAGSEIFYSGNHNHAPYWNYNKQGLNCGECDLFEKLSAYTRVVLFKKEGINSLEDFPETLEEKNYRLQVFGDNSF